jgi:hypothetical protein
MEATESDPDYYFAGWEETGQAIVETNPFSITILLNRIINALFINLPSYSDAVEVWDGKIIDIKGVKYFKGKKGVGNLLITGYDFAENVLSGMPYKSNAKISAPAGNVILIAADVNNFLYAANGTPNQIPVSCFFQNIDYANRFFTKHALQELTTVSLPTDVVGIYEDVVIETYEPRVSLMVLYANTKTGTDLTACNTYYNVPTEDVGAKWIDFANGNDTWDGSKIRTTGSVGPYKTISNVISLTLTAGTNIYVKTGLSSLGTQHSISKVYNFIGVGYTRIVSSSNAFYVNGGGNILLKGFELAGISGVYSHNAYTTTVERCSINGTSSASWLISAANVILKHCPINTTISTVRINETANAHNVTIDTCKQKYVENHQVTYYNGNLQANVFNYKYSDFANLITLCSGTWTILCNKFTNGAVYTENTYNHTGTLDFVGNILTPNLGSTYLLKIGLLTSTKNAFVCTVRQNTFTDNYADNYDILLYEQASAMVRNNIFNHTGTASTNYFVVLENRVNTCTAASIINNVFNSSTYKPYCTIGTDDAACANKMQNPKIERNRMTHSIPNTEHGCGIFRQNNLSMKYNYSENSGIAYITKALESESSGGVVMYNLAINCANGLLAKGSNGIKFYNNTIVNTLSNLVYAFNLMNSEYAGSVMAMNCEFKNNIIYNTTTGSVVLFIPASMDESDITDNGNVLSNNIIYSPNTPYAAFASTLAAAQLLGLEANSLSTNPNLDANYIPTVAIENAEDLGETYEDGLDVTTDWGDENTLPVVVTKKQGAVWQNGAYIKQN